MKKRKEKRLILYLNGGGDVQMQLVPERTHRLEGPHVLHVADAPNGGAGWEQHSINALKRTCTPRTFLRTVSGGGKHDQPDFVPERRRNG